MVSIVLSGIVNLVPYNVKPPSESDLALNPIYCLAIGIENRALLGVTATPYAPFRRVNPLGRGGEQQHATMISPNSSEEVTATT